MTEVLHVGAFSTCVCQPDRHASDWPDASIETLKRMYADGASASEIGAAVGRSRGAVCGKLFRLGLTNKTRSRPRKRSQPPYRASAGLGARLLRIKGESFEPRTDNIVDLPPDQSDCAVPFMKLGPQHCRWPLPDRMYCGDLRHGEHSYCDRHCRIAYRPARERAA